MAIGKDGLTLRRLQALFDVGAIRELSDGQLLERFATGRGDSAELAFAALVERHGPMVLRVCRGILADPHDAQDAFQATFLVLVRKARGLWVRDSIGPWLHQVAYRAASGARSAAARRRRLEQKVAEAPSRGDPGFDNDLIRVIHEEIERLPERFRSPVILCDLEGRTHEQAARHLGWPVGTVKSRLSRARDRLRDRLSRQGLANGPLGLAVAPPIPPALVDATTAASTRFLVARAIAPGSAALLAQGVLQSMMILRWLKVASALLLVGATSSGVALVAQDGVPKGDGPAVRAVDAPTVKVGPGRLRVTVNEPGLVERPRASAVRSEIEGETAIINILPDGSKVKRGDVVGVLDSATVRDLLNNQKIAVQQAEASFRQAVLTRDVEEDFVKKYVQGIYIIQRKAALESEAARARSDVEKDTARLERARRMRKGLEELRGPGAARTPSDLLAEFLIEDVLGDAGHDLERDIAALDQAKERLQTLERDRDREEARIMKLREEDGDPTLRQLRADIEKARADEVSKKATWEREKAREEQLERQFRASTLRAPADGAIVLDRVSDRQVPFAEGMTVRPRQKIFDVVDLAGPVRLVVKVPEAIVDQIRLGSVARVRGIALGKQLLTGTVESVAGVPDAYPPGAVRKLYTTRVAIPTSPLVVPSNMMLDVEIVIAELDGVIAVPIAAVIHNDGKPHVLVKTADGAIDWRKVTLGTANNEIIEIKQGLKAGEAVVLDPVALITERESRPKSVPATPAAAPR